MYVQKLIYREQFVDLMVSFLKPFRDMIFPLSPFYWCCKLIYLSNTSLFSSHFLPQYDKTCFYFQLCLCSIVHDSFL